MNPSNDRSLVHVATDDDMNVILAKEWSKILDEIENRCGGHVSTYMEHQKPNGEPYWTVEWIDSVQGEITWTVTRERLL